MDSSCCIMINRIILAVCLAAVAVLVAMGNGFCVMSNSKNNQTGTVCDAKGSPFSISHWADGSTYKELQAQYAVFIAALIFFLVAFGLICLMCVACDANKYFVIFVGTLGGFVMLVAAIMEAWFAAGFGKTQEIGPFYVRSWIIASALCFVSVLLFITDIILVTKC